MTWTAQWLSAAAPAIQDWIGSISWIDAAEFFFVTMSVVGQHFISQRNPRGFAYWIAGNVAALIMFVALGRWMTVLLYCYFLWMCFKGLATWRKLDARSNEDGHAAASAGQPVARPVG